MRNKSLIIVGIVLIAFVVSVSGCTSSTGGNKNAIDVSNVRAVNDGYGMYNVYADITPKQNIDYMEMHLIAYDSSGAVIEKTPLAWNINKAVAGQTIKAKGMMSLYQQGTPAKIDVLIYDTFSDDPSKALYKKTITL